MAIGNCCAGRRRRPGGEKIVLGVALVLVVAPAASLAGGERAARIDPADVPLLAWGRNVEGQCNIPDPVVDFVDVAAGGLFSLGLLADGSIVAWGNNLYGQCNVPEPNTGFVSVVAGVWHNLAMRSDHSLVPWGRNNYGQCNVPEPDGQFTAVSAGELHSLGLMRNITATLEFPVLAARLFPNRPNPFNPRTTLTFETPRFGSVRLQMFDLRGRLVRTLIDGLVPGGRHAVSWDGRDGRGAAMPSGVYVTRLATGGQVVSSRVTLAR